MSHRKFEAPRHGSLAFLPKKRCRRGQGRIQAFPKDDASKKPHLTGFAGFKAGMTHVVREINRPGSKLHKKDVVESCTVIDCPDMVAIGVVGYKETQTGLRAVTTCYAGYLSDDARRRLYRKWYCSKKRAFTKYMKAFAETKGEDRLKKIAEESAVVRLIVHSQPSKVPGTQRKAHVMEIQINGGSIAEKVEFAKGLFEKTIPVNTVFTENEMIDTITITKGKGFQGVIKRWGVTRLPRKTHRGLRKVACIGAWHPARVQFQVARAGQQGYHHRTQMHKKVYRIGAGSDPRNAGTNCDLTEKAITPMGGFPGYGTVKNDFLLIKGAVAGPRRRLITLRKTLFPPTSRKALEASDLKFIDTSSKRGHGKFQTSGEKANWMGPLKKDKKVATE
ncbi:60S ribosomal protein L3 [Gregarina niphandrodes]|uniref:60S ribosomal protein L3 n=1 Tax=Gregarina niphandrodes TaxID=110365 RepID=A0A023AY62_GRENI|nr:60S ribosomal protein L3 [Gregarina niphandrodes]EZG43591.1 60S ribosomal protein L3 [Gregarina niphandrodes]|eukprot:XP_011133183.1 60S ribosomal protein L3 [Gregarina niphandrodes]